MELKPITVHPDDLPAALRPYVSGAATYDSSCSPTARVIYSDKDRGYFLKISARGTLEKESVLTDYFHRKGLAAKVAEYISDDERDYLLTEKIYGDDCIAQKYLDEPKRLCDVLAGLLARLHDLDPADCPVDHRENYRAVIKRNHAAGCFDLSYCDIPEVGTPEAAYRYVEENFGLFEKNTLLHGDYCLPNVILRDWNFSGFVDLGNGGVGDRHVDLYWGAWTLRYNLGTDEFGDRFFDAYGRDKIDPERLRLVGACEVFG